MCFFSECKTQATDSFRAAFCYNTFYLTKRTDSKSAVLELN